MTVSSSSLQSAQVQAVRSGVGCMPLPQYGWLEIAGEDAAGFLQTQTTNDVLKLADGEGQANAILDRKGHLLSFFTLHRWGGRFFLFQEKSQIPATIQHLEQYHFTEDVTFTDHSDAMAIYTVQGPEAWKLLKPLVNDLTPLTEHQIVKIDAFESPAMLIRRSFTGEAGYCLVFPTSLAPQFKSALMTQGKPLNLAEISPAAFETLRIEAGTPFYGIDMDAEVLLPATGLEQASVSYAKGCYIGQEVVAKIKTYGGIQKALVGLKFDASLLELPPHNASILLNEKEIGTLKSLTHSPTLGMPIAMAYLARDYRVPNQKLDVFIEGKPYTVTVTLLPFYTPLADTARARKLYEQGLDLFANDQPKQAIERLREAIDLDPHLADAYEALGVILSKQEEYDEAIALMQRLAELNPDEVMAHTNLSVFYMKKGMKTEAEAEKDKATILGFKKAMTESQLKKNEAEERQKKQQMLEDRVRMFQEVLGLDSEDALANYGLGSSLNELGRAEESIPYLEKAIALDAKHTVAYLALGKAFEAIEKPEAAKAIYEKGIEVAAKRGDLMPLNEMQQRLAKL